MSGYSVQQNYYRNNPLTVDTHAHKFFEEDESSILDENILEPSALDSGLEMSPPMDGSRRESYAVSSAIFSPKTDDWHVDMQSNPSNNPFVDTSSNPFINPAHATSFAQQGHSWPLGNGSGSGTPLQAFDGLPADYDGSGAVGYRTTHGQPPFGHPGQALFSPSNSNGSMPTSPHKDWMTIDGMPKRMQPNSPGLRSHSPLLRRDGIRKKNARFDIPAERNLLNIDQLIANSTDEQEIKELKQQKRLLRNRQAALDSRQRKKQHTERLEDEKKHFTAVINELEEQLAEAKIVMDEYARKEQQYQQYIESLRLEKEEMLRSHTIETGDLRKKVNVLTEHVQKMDNNTMPTVQSSAGYTTEYADIDSLTMEGAWDSCSFLNDYPADPEIKSEMPVVTAKKAETTLISEQDKPAAQGLLLMLLLFGAFVASKGSSPSIPRMSDDVRAASATLLEDIFKDAGVPQTVVHPSTNVVDAMAPLPSGDSWSTAPSHLTADNIHQYASSSLGDYVDSLAQPTEAQKHEQLFSLTAAQYDGVVNPEYLRSAPANPPSRGRRNLAESLAAMRSNSKQSAAEVYTRSLLWEQVPKDVVRDFAKLVSECNSRVAQEEPIG